MNRFADSDSVRNRWRRCCATLAILAAGLAATPSFARPVAGDVAPDVAGYTADGHRVSLADYAGKVVVLSFWASWCAPCRKELPILEGIARTAGPDRVEVVAVNIEGADVYRRLSPKMSALMLLVASDASHDAQTAYGVNGIPHMVIIGKDGKIFRVHRGYSDAGVDEAIDDLNRALAR